MSYAEVEMKVIQWAEKRRIIPNSTPMAQWIKACQEMEELRLGLVNRDDAEIKDGVGDVMVCLINLCALADIDLVKCLEGAYQEIKDRTGHMGEDGIFYKDK
jgi:NTP pyrophosphatase (non-canonical NTP hydrolase)